MADWTAPGALRAILRDHTQLQRRANERAQRWLAAIFSGVPAADATFGQVTALLNDPTHLVRLNEALADCYLSARCVSLDADGVQLSKPYLSQLERIHTQRQALQERETVLRREAELEELARDKERAARRFEIQMERQQAEARQAVAQAEAAAAQTVNETALQMVKGLIAAGVDPHDAANVHVAATNAKMLAVAAKEGASVAVAPTVVGLDGLARMHTCTSTGVSGMSARHASAQSNRNSDCTADDNWIATD